MPLKPNVLSCGPSASGGCDLITSGEIKLSSRPKLTGPFFFWIEKKADAHIKSAHHRGAETNAGAHSLQRSPGTIDRAAQKMRLHWTESNQRTAEVSSLQINVTHREFTRKEMLNPKCWPSIEPFTSVIEFSRDSLLTWTGQKRVPLALKVWCQPITTNAPISWNTFRKHTLSYLALNPPHIGSDASDWLLQTAGRKHHLP